MLVFHAIEGSSSLELLSSVAIEISKEDVVVVQCIDPLGVV